MSTPSDAVSGMVRIASRHPVQLILDRLEQLLKEHGVQVFARIDFAADAARSGLTMRAEQLLIFGNPKAGTPLMLSAPTVGIDLPLKALAWEDADGQVWLAHNQASYVTRRHSLPDALAANLATVVPLLERAAAQ